MIRRRIGHCRKLEAEPGCAQTALCATKRWFRSTTAGGREFAGGVDSLKGDVEAVPRNYFARRVSVERDGDARRQLNLHLKSSVAVDVQKLLENLPAN